MTNLVNRLTDTVSHRGGRAKNQIAQYFRRRAHARAMSPLDPRDRDIVEGLEATGTFVTHLDRLAETGIAGSDALLVQLDEIARELEAAAGENGNQKVVSASTETIMAHPEVLKWGLNERLLTIIENYLGLPAAYRGLTVRRDIANGVQVGTRYWHRDGEDSRIVKIIVYLRDVTPEDGPFCYVPKAPIPDSAFNIFDGNRVSDAEMSAAVSADRQVECPGPAGTVLFADPCSIWHKGKPGTGADRFAAFFAYNCDKPLRPDLTHPMFPTADFLAANTDLTDRQRRALR